MGKTDEKPKTTKNGAPKKPNLWVRFTEYLRGVIAELKRVVWPSREEVINSTIIVVVTLTFFAIFTYAIDTISSGGIMQLMKLAE